MQKFLFLGANTADAAIDDFCASQYEIRSLAQAVVNIDTNEFNADDTGTACSQTCLKQNYG